MSWKCEVWVEGEWSTNALRFGTEDEAERYGRDLLSRWLVPSASRAAESDDPVNYVFDDAGVLRRLADETPTGGITP